MKKIMLGFAAMTVFATAIAQQCGLSGCPIPPTFTVGAPAKTFYVACTAPGGSFTDSQPIFQATGNSTTVQANAVSNSSSSTWLNSMAVNGDASAKCFHNFRNNWEGCSHLYNTTPTYEYTVTVNGTVSCTTSGNVPYTIFAQ